MPGPQSHPLIGKTVARVTKMSDSTMDDLGWGDYSGHMDRELYAVIEFDDGDQLFAMRDPEGNGPGVLVHRVGDIDHYVIGEDT